TQPLRQLAHLALDLLARGLVARALVFLEQGLQALLGRRGLVGQRGQVLQPLPAQKIVQLEGIVLELGHVLGRLGGQPRQRGRLERAAPPSALRIRQWLGLVAPPAPPPPPPPRHRAPPP